MEEGKERGRQREGEEGGDEGSVRVVHIHLHSEYHAHAHVAIYIYIYYLLYYTGEGGILVEIEPNKRLPQDSIGSPCGMI